MLEWVWEGMGAWVVEAGAGHLQGVCRAFAGHWQGMAGLGRACHIRIMPSWARYGAGPQWVEKAIATSTLKVIYRQETRRLGSLAGR